MSNEYLYMYMDMYVHVYVLNSNHEYKMSAIIIYKVHSNYNNRVSKLRSTKLHVQYISVQYMYLILAKESLEAHSYNHTYNTCIYMSMLWGNTCTYM